MTIRLQLSFLLLSCVGLLTANTASGAIILGNFDNNAGESTPAFSTTSINPNQHKGVSFTLASAVEIDTLYLALTNFNDDDDFTVAIRNGDINGSAVAIFDQVSPTPSTANTALTWAFDSSAEIILGPGTYAIDLREATNTYTWSVAVDLPYVPPTGMATFGAFQFDDGSGITDSATYNSFRLTGTAVPAPSVLWLLGLPLALLALGRGSMPRKR